MCFSLTYETKKSKVKRSQTGMGKGTMERKKERKKAGKKEGK